MLPWVRWEQIVVPKALGGMGFEEYFFIFKSSCSEVLLAFDKNYQPLD